MKQHLSNLIIFITFKKSFGSCSINGVFIGSKIECPDFLKQLFQRDCNKKSI